MFSLETLKPTDELSCNLVWTLCCPACKVVDKDYKNRTNSIRPVCIGCAAVIPTKIQFFTQLWLQSAVVHFIDTVKWFESFLKCRNWRFVKAKFIVQMHRRGTRVTRTWCMSPAAQCIVSIQACSVPSAGASLCGLGTRMSYQFSSPPLSCVRRATQVLRSPPNFAPLTSEEGPGFENATSSLKLLQETFLDFVHSNSERFSKTRDLSPPLLLWWSI